ncbi:MAG: helix-turn-helix domain-containing protein [Paramuribaculum sp.]|nr:helix-turn-helix domain-containing protein [Paramuribaculum sp.]
MSNAQIPQAHAENMRKYSRQFSSLADGYIFSRVTKTEQFAEFSSQTMRLRGITMILCLSGTVTLNVNMEPFQLVRNSLLVIPSQSVFRLGEVDWDTLDAYVFILSPEFLRDINFEISILTSYKISSSQPAQMQLTDEEASLMGRYLDLVHYNTVDNTDAIYVRSISRALIAAAVYQLMQFAGNHDISRKPVKLSRRDKYVKEFITLVSQCYKRERSVAYYAGKLFISPKYLSYIVKEHTGRSAAQWIDDYVILEAKNLLRYSGKNVQQIAYELNFSNQSSFGKYFKHLTGMSPTEYQKS